MFKKITKNTLLTSTLILLGLSFCRWAVSQFNRWTYGSLDQDFPYQDNNVEKLNCDGSTDLWNCTSIKEDNDEWDPTIIRRLLWIFGLDTSTDRDLKFIDYAKAIINMALWLVSFIALVVTIYTFYMMFFSENEAGIKKAKWNLTGIFIALAIIWLAWIIISFIFRRYKSNLKDKENDLSTNNLTMISEIDQNNQIYLTI